MLPKSTVTKYIDPLTDFGFKRMFGSEPNKDLLIDLLNSIFDGRKQIVDLEYNRNEHIADIKDEGTAIFDLTCTGIDGERFIIEVQRGRPANFKKRAIYYTSMLAASQAPKGDRSAWAYNLPEIYFIALLEEFSVEDTSDGNYVRDICLVNRYTGKIFYEGLGYIFLELVNFVKEEAELESNLDKWLYVLKNISRMDKIPLFMRKTIFEKVFSIAEYSNMTKEEKTMYNAALKRKWDNHSVMVEAIRDAVEKERAKAEKEKEHILLEAKVEKEHILLEAKAEKKKSVEILKRMGMPVKDIAKVVGLSEKEIEQL